MNYKKSRINVNNIGNGKLPRVARIGTDQVGIGKVWILWTRTRQLLYEEPVKSVRHLGRRERALQEEDHQRRMIKRLKFQSFNELRKVVD